MRDSLCRVYRPDESIAQLLRAVCARLRKATRVLCESVAGAVCSQARQAPGIIFSRPRRALMARVDMCVRAAFASEAAKVDA